MREAKAGPWMRIAVLAGAAFLGGAGCTALFGIDDGTLAASADAGDGSVEATADQGAPADQTAPPGDSGGLSDAADSGSLADGSDAATCGPHCVVSATLGEAHVCALLGDGTVSCWGDDTYSQLGDNIYVADGGGPDPTTPKATPNVINGLSGVTAIAAGAAHTCAVAHGSVYCWGFDDLGECGDGRAQLTSPITTHFIVGVPTLVPGITNAVEIHAHGESSCARLSDGSMTCWGANIYGGLGSPSPAGFQACTATAVGAAPCTPSPQGCQTGMDFGSFDVGYLHTCGLGASSGTLYCWGDDEVGELGVDLDGGSSTGPVSASLPSAPKTIATGISHTCAILSDGTLYCWGYGAEGQLGDGVDLSSSTPSLSLTPGGVTVAGLSAGYYNTVIVLSDGTVACAGSDKSDQCGIVATDNCPNANFAGACVLSFKRVPNLSGIRGVASGFLATCAITTAGELYCWGDDSFGELGDGHNGAVDGGFFDPILTPTRVPL